MAVSGTPFAFVCNPCLSHSVSYLMLRITLVDVGDLFSA